MAVQTLVPAGRLEGFLLGGGYGRGEGGALRIADRDRPYNDLDCYVLLRGNLSRNRKRLQPVLNRVAHHFSNKSELEIEITPLSRQKLESSSVTMFYYDLIAGHRWLIGDDSLLVRCQHHLAATEIPFFEATRLLMNRCSGLLFAKERLLRQTFTPADADFVGRNLAKAQLGFGDTLLAAFGQYHWSCQKRRQRVLGLLPTGAMPWLREVQQHHCAGVEFKLHPYRSTACAEELRSQLLPLADLGLHIFLWIERHRLQANFTSPEDYILGHIDKCPETNSWRNRLINLSAFGMPIAVSRSGSRYPRERLLHALALLLWASDRITRPRLLDTVQEALRTGASDFSELVHEYHVLWKRFN